MAFPLSAWMIIGCFWPLLIRSLSYIAGHHIAAPDVDHYVEVQSNPADSGGEIGDVQTTERFWSDSSEPWNGSGFLGWSCSSAPVHLAVGVGHPVETAHRADVQPLIGQGWHDLPWRQ